MDNRTNAEDKNLNQNKIVLTAAVVGFFLVGGLFFVFKDKFSSDSVEPSPLNQESFQGPAELSSAVQADCQSSGLRILKETNCAEKESEFFAKAETCANVFVAYDQNQTDSFAEGSYSDLVFQIVQCYANKNNAVSDALAILQKVNQLPAWEVTRGSSTCNSKFMLAAYTESYKKADEFKCYKADGWPLIVEELKKSNIQLLRQLIPKSSIVSQGVSDSDLGCPEVIEKVLNNIQKYISSPSIQVNDLASQDVTFAESTDRYLEFSQNNLKILDLQFGLDSNQCIIFKALLFNQDQQE